MLLLMWGRDRHNRSPEKGGRKGKGRGKPETKRDSQGGCQKPKPVTKQPDPFREMEIGGSSGS